MLQQLTTINAPGSKSLSHRALACAALARGESWLTGVLRSDDTARTMEVLALLGAGFHEEGEALVVRGLGAAPAGGNEPLLCDMGESGTSCRLLTALLAAGEGEFEVLGAGRMYERPIGGLVEPLRLLGAEVEYLGRQGCPPLRIKTAGLSSGLLPGGVLAVSAEESSQYLSGFLLAAPFVRQGTRPLRLMLGGNRAVSWPYVGLTLQVMRHFGVAARLEELRADGNWAEAEKDFRMLALPGRLRFAVPEGGYTAANYQVEGDWSSASYFLAAGAVGTRPVTVTGLERDSAQGDRVILDILQKMGAEVSWAGKAVTVSPPARGLFGTEVDLGDAPDLAPTVLAVAAHASGATIIRNAEHLRFKESDRAEALARELRKAGCVTMQMPGTVVLAPPENGLKPPAEETVFSTYGDHRLAMAFHLLGLPSGRGGGFEVRLDNADCISKSYPKFPQDWSKVRPR